jgi:hypothetical protein
MATEKPDTVKVRALQAHTHNGTAYEIGDTYEIAADLVDSVTVQGKAELADKPSAPPAKPSHPVEPMGTDDLGVKPKPKK